MPVAPSTSTRSSFRTGARHATGIHPAIPAMPHDAAISSETPSGSGMPRSAGAVARSASSPSRDEPEPRAEEVHARAVGAAADALAAGDVRERRVTAEVASRADVDVDRVERHCRDAVDELARGVIALGELRWTPELADQRSPHRAACSCENVEHSRRMRGA